jgi:hypothetical protein
MTSQVTESKGKIERGNLYMKHAKEIAKVIGMQVGINPELGLAFLEKLFDVEIYKVDSFLSDVQRQRRLEVDRRARLEFEKKQLRLFESQG